MVLHYFYKTTAWSIFVVVAALTLANFLPDNLFNDFPLDPKSRAAPSYNPLTEWNTLLSDNVEYIQLNNIFGPESIAFNNGMLYTGLLDGRLVEINTKDKNKIREVGRMKDSEFCKSFDNTPYGHGFECGRILQVKYINSTIYASDATKGLHSFDVKSGTKKSLLPNLEKSVTGLFNSFVFDPQNSDIVYYTVSSRKWNIESIVWSLIDSDDSSILVAASLSTGKAVIIMDRLAMANGIDVDVKHNQILLVESCSYRVHKIPLTAARKAFESAVTSGQTNLVPSELLIDLIPGVPDNIHVNGDFAFIGVPIINRNGPQLLDYLSDMPRVRKAIGRFVYLTGKFFKLFHDKVWKNPTLDSLSFDLISGHIGYKTLPEESAVLKYNLITGKYQLFGSDRFAFVSECVIDDQGNMYLGSFRNPFIAKVRLP